MLFRVLRALFNFAKAHYNDTDGNSLFPDNPVEQLSATKAWFKINRKQSYIKRSDLPKWYSAVINLKNEHVFAKADTVRDYFAFFTFNRSKTRRSGKHLSGPMSISLNPLLRSLIQKIVKRSRYR